MDIFLTLDYEIYFGEQHGSVEKCIITPTNELMKISEATGAKMTFFVDVGFIIKLEEFKSEYPVLEQDYQAIVGQIKQLVATGHDCQLHIHPHWEDSHYNGHRWVINVDRYKLADFEAQDIHRIVSTYKEKLGAITQQPVTVYRAGGWCLQPFEKVRKAFLDNGLKLDSTVFKGGHYETKHYYYDFRNCPEGTQWRFSTHLCESDPEGEFLEVPIANMKVGPLFFWQLFGWGRLNPSQHKPIGDGYPIPSPGTRKKFLTQYTNNAVSLDGYFATLLNRAVKQQQHKGNELVVIGHPKACTWYSLKQLQKFIMRQRHQHSFKVLSDMLEA